MIVSRTSRIPKKKLFLAAADAMGVAVAMFWAVVLRFVSEYGWQAGWPMVREYIFSHLPAIGAAWAIFMMTFYLAGLYEPARIARVLPTVSTAALAVLSATLLIAGIFYATLAFGIGRGIFLLFALLVFVFAVALRLAYALATERGFFAQRCLIIGTNAEAKQAIKLLKEHPHSGIRMYGLISCGHEKVGKFVGDYPVLGSLDNLQKFVELYDIESLILATSPDEEPALLKQLRPFRYRGIMLMDFVTLHEQLAGEIPLEHINDEWLLQASMNSSVLHIRKIKRLMDLAASSVGLVVTAPIVAVAAVLIKLDSPGPVLYRQERLGRDSRPFTLIKFRTMRADAEQETGPVWAADDDPRITRVGKWLRKFRIDEIPQLLNVFRGEMSLVGPRPEREVFIKKLTEKIPFYSERLLVQPGITGWAQVMHPYTASMEEARRKLQFDLYYIKHMSFSLDLYILAKTVKTVLFGRERSAARPAAAPATPPQPARTQVVPFTPESAKAAESDAREQAQ
jgi:exopolysaccharide biosynthesis polyprenyl glycosylphosphotransferase